MRKIICIVLAIAIIASFSVVPCFAANSNADIKDKDALKEASIMKLFDERQKLFFNKPVDISKLNEIDIKLNSLGVDFLTLEEVERQFPEAKAIKDKALKGETANKASAGTDVIANVVTPSSNVNTWASFRYSNQYYNGKYYNVQKLIAQPISEDSGLWEEGQRTVNFSLNWKAGITNLIESIALSAAGSIASTPITVYDALSSVWDGLKTVSDIDPSNVTYRWETQTTAVFTYVRLESQSDDYQWLSHISTKCVTEVAYIVDVDSWRQNGTGSWVVYPDLEADTRYLYHTPTYYNSTSRALWAYNNVSGTYHDAISECKCQYQNEQKIENKNVQKINLVLLVCVAKICCF